MMLKYIRIMLLLIWQLPQSIIGLLVVLFLRATKWVTYDMVWFGVHEFKTGSISLGCFVILQRGFNADTFNHEAGHCMQSRMLGPLYLFVIGLPSLVWCILHTYSGYFSKKNYYSFYTEKWADKLSYVIRK